jgi:hypothetical protein
MSGGLWQPTDAPGTAPTGQPHTTGGHGQQVAGTSTTASTGDMTATVGDMNAINRLLAGTAWTQEDVSLGLQMVTTAVLLYWIMMEVR